MLDDHKLRLWDRGILVQTDTLTILTGNGGYKVVFDNLWFHTDGSQEESVDEYVDVYVEGDKIIAMRTGVPEDGFIVSYYVTDSRGEKKYFDLETRTYIGDF